VLESSVAGSTQNSSFGLISTSGIGSNFDSSKGGSCGSGAPSSARHQEMASLGWSSGDRALITSKQIPIGTLKSIIEGAELSVDDFR
jgi:hypothetical protein